MVNHDLSRERPSLIETPVVNTDSRRHSNRRDKTSDTRYLRKVASRSREPSKTVGGYEAAVPERAASHDAPAASSFLYLISASG